MRIKIRQLDERDRENEIIREFGIIDNGLMLWIPEYQQYVCIQQGICNTYEYVINEGFIETDTIGINTEDNLILSIYDVLEDLYQDRETQFIVIQSI